jgi:sulfur-oxidizing protein SoxA
MTAPIASAPLDDLKTLQQHFFTQFPTLSRQDFANGVYALDPDAKQSWLAIEQFPPYEIAIDLGKQLFTHPFNNGHHYGDCFPDYRQGISQHYPYWDLQADTVVTLSQAINRCRLQNQAPPLPPTSRSLINLTAYLSFLSRNKPIAITVPPEPAARAAYQQGKKYYHQRRGQLNFSCASCHIQNAGKRLRTETLSPLLGQTSNWPTYRLKWGRVGTLHQRFIGCHKQIRAQTAAPQSEIFRNLEYYMSYISNGLPVNGPSIRK